MPHKQLFIAGCQAMACIHALTRMCHILMWRTCETLLTLMDARRRLQSFSDHFLCWLFLPRGRAVPLVGSICIDSSSRSWCARLLYTDPYTPIYCWHALRPVLFVFIIPSIESQQKYLVSEYELLVWKMQLSEFYIVYLFEKIWETKCVFPPCITGTSRVLLYSKWRQNYLHKQFQIV